MSFYITLPSNSSAQFYPNNTLSNYTTKLNSHIKLDGEYEVALVEAMYPYNWKIRRDASIIFKEKTRIEIYKIRFAKFATVNELVKDINDFTIIKNIPCKIYMDNNSVTMEFFKALNIEFTEMSHVEIGFKYHKFGIVTDEYKKYAGEKLIDLEFKTISSLYVYTDIIDFQFVGNAYAPLLRVVGVDESYEKYGEHVDVVYTSPHYVPVSRSIIDSIEIDIRDDTGEAVQFQAGKVIVKLHFRHRTYY